MKKVLVVMLCVLIIFSVCGISFAQEKASDTEIQQVTVDGLKDMIEANKGKVVLVNFWAIWCGYCVDEIPALISLYNKYKDEGLEIIGISFDKNAMTIDESGMTVLSKFIKEHSVNYPIYLSIDATSGKYELCKEYGIQGFPTTIFYDRDGNRVTFYSKSGYKFDKIVGAKSESFFEEEILKVLNK